MKLRSLFVLVSLFVFAGLGVTQRTVTNAALDKYKDQRVRAADDLRHNYARLGFPSPDEMVRREEERNKVRNDLAAKLRQQDIEDERLLMQYRMAMAAAYASRPQTIVIDAGGYDDGSFIQAGGFGFGHRFRPERFRGFQPTGYFAGGQFWPTGNQTPLRPMFGGRRH